MDKEKVSFYFPVFRGFGIEHEVMFFHHTSPEIGKNKQFTSTINKKVFSPSYAMKYLKEDADIPEQYLKFLESLPALEQSGRKCGGEWVLKKAGNDLLVEFANRGWFEQLDLDKSSSLRFYDAYVDDIIQQEVLFRDILQTFLPSDILKRNRYGFVSPIPFGMYPFISAPKSQKSSLYRNKTHSDYTGSYHMTITLPFPFRPSWNYSKRENQLFVEIHRNFANMIQWIEPLLCSSFFTPDLTASGPNGKLKTRGSFRVFRLGWGNFAGSDLRKLEKGISRYANIKPYWRKGLNKMEGTQKLKLCDKVKLEPGAISAVGSDFRTFGSRDLLRPWHRESGLPMNIPNGLEMRILDHFDSTYLYFMVQLIILIAEHSRIHNIGDNFVYHNVAWIKAMDQVMRLGWRARLPEEYIELISNFFDVEFDKNTRRAFDVFESLYKQLWKRHHKGAWSFVLGSPELMERRFDVPNVNREGWEMGWLLWLNTNPKECVLFKEWLKSLPNRIDSWELWDDYWNIFIQSLPEKYQDGKLWGSQEKDVAYFLESVGMYDLGENGEMIRNKNFNEILFVELMESYITYFRQMTSFDKRYFMGFLQEIKPELFELLKMDRIFQNQEGYIDFINRYKQPVIQDYLKIFKQIHLEKNVVPEKKRSKLNKTSIFQEGILPVWHIQSTSMASKRANTASVGAGMGEIL